MPLTKFFLFARKYFRGDHRDVPKSRKSLERAAKLIPESYRNFQRHRIDLKDFDAEWIHPNNKMKRVILYLHGGGFLIGGTETHRPMVSRLAEYSESSALLINYRLAPENPYPSALDDAVSAYQYLLQEGYFPEEIIVGGDSAGGGLTVSLMLYLKDNKLPLPKAAILLCPWTDLTLSGESIAKNADYDAVLSKEAMEFMREQYAGQYDFLHPYISPLWGDLRGLPPIYIQAGSIDPILDDSVRLYEKLKENDVSVKLDVYPGKFHVWQAFFHFIRDGKKALHALALFIKEQYPEN